MATVTPSNQLTWSRTLSWAFNHLNSHGRPEARVYRTAAETAEHYVFGADGLSKVGSGYGTEME
jgi:hypothetical protein